MREPKKIQTQQQQKTHCTRTSDTATSEVIRSTRRESVMSELETIPASSWSGWRRFCIGATQPHTICGSCLPITNVDQLITYASAFDGSHYISAHCNSFSRQRCISQCSAICISVQHSRKKSQNNITHKDSHPLLIHSSSKRHRFRSLAASMTRTQSTHRCVDMPRIAWRHFVTKMPRWQQCGNSDDDDCGGGGKCACACALPALLCIHDHIAFAERSKFVVIAHDTHDRKAQQHWFTRNLRHTLSMLLSTQ